MSRAVWPNTGDGEPATIHHAHKPGTITATCLNKHFNTPTRACIPFVCGAMAYSSAIAAERKRDKAPQAKTP
eukprot:740575-Alexandrium_andersonii.AAC.1